MPTVTRRHPFRLDKIDPSVLVVAIFAPAPPPATAVRGVALALARSFSFISTQGGNNEH
jgi:hypothetical protein